MIPAALFWLGVFVWLYRREKRKAAQDATHPAD